jgi:isopenicillin N synthase-like dioxygenase
VLEAVRVALDLPAASWRALTSDPVSVLRFLDYPDLAGGIRMGPHLDDTLITVLHQSVPVNGFAALQVRLPGEDVWRSVAPSDDVFVVNVGETLTFLSGGRVVATRHQVVAPPPELAEGSARTSLAYFHLPNWDARLRPAKWHGPRGQRTRFDREEFREPDGSVLFYKAHALGVESLTRGRKGTSG